MCICPDASGRRPFSKYTVQKKRRGAAKTLHAITVAASSLQSASICGLRGTRSHQVALSCRRALRLKNTACRGRPNCRERLMAPSSLLLSVRPLENISRLQTPQRVGTDHFCVCKFGFDDPCEASSPETERSRSIQCFSRFCKARPARATSTATKPLSSPHGLARAKIDKPHGSGLPGLPFSETARRTRGSPCRSMEGQVPSTRTLSKGGWSSLSQLRHIASFGSSSPLGEMPLAFLITFRIIRLQASSTCSLRCRDTQSLRDSNAPCLPIHAGCVPLCRT